MPTLENLTRASIEAVLKGANRRNARDYLSRVQDRVRSGNRLLANIVGGMPLAVEIEVNDGGIQARCGCGYQWSGICQHAGAVLLNWLAHPDTFTDRPAPPPNPDYPIDVFEVKPPATFTPKERPDWLTRPFAARRQNEDESLQHMLENLRVQDLRQMAKKRDWSIRGTRKDDIIEQVVEQMSAPASIRQGIDSLDREHRQVFWSLVLLGYDPANTYEDLERVAKTWGALKSFKQTATYSGHLADWGLAMSGENVATYPKPINFVPMAVLRHLPPIPNDIMPASSDLGAAQAANELHFADPFPLVRAANQLILMLEQSPPPLRTPQPRPRLEKFQPGLAEWPYDPHDLNAVMQNGKLKNTGKLTLAVPPPPPTLPDEVIQRLAPVAGDEDRLEFLMSLLTVIGLVKPGSPVTVWPEIKHEFLQRSELAQRAILARTYFEMINWSELWTMLGQETGLQLRRDWLYYYYKAFQMRADLTRLRQRVLLMLAALPDNQWLTVADLFERLRLIWPQFERAETNMYYGYYPQQQHKPWFLTKTADHQPLNTTNQADWQLAQGNFVRRIITGPLSWLGLADLSMAEGELHAFRLHGLADLILNRVEVPPAPPHAALRTEAAASPVEGTVEVDQDVIIVDPANVSAQAHSYLDKIARLEQAAPTGFVYRLDAQAVYEAFEVGFSLNQALDDWETLLPIPMPNQLRRRLMSWWQAYGRVRIYENVTLIEFADDYALTEMKAVTSLTRHLIAEISPRAVLIPSEVVEFLSTELEKAGYTPKQTETV